MYLAHPVDNSDESLWLVVQRDQRCRVFELPPSGNKTVVFGASVDANVKLPGAVPIALHVERDAKGVWLTPGYVDPELRVDGQPLGSRRMMCDRAVVESPGVTLVLQVRDTPPTVRGGWNRFDDTTLSDGAIALSDTTVIPCLTTQARAYGESGVKTEELNAYEIRKALERYSAEPTARSMAPVPVESVTAEAESRVQSLESQRTVALRPVVLPEPTNALPPAQSEQPHRAVPSALRETGVLSNPQRRPSGDTTTYDGAALRQLLSQREQPTIVVPVAKPTSSTLPLMTRLGILAKEKPLYVLASAALGSLFLVVFMVGAANLVSGGQKAKFEQASSLSLSSNETPRQAPTPQASTVAVVPAVSSATAIPTAVVDNATATTDDAIDPSIQAAVGHLFAGRSAEAEQAYRELAAKHPDNGSYVTLTKVLARRNSPDCRSAADSKKSCPKVKP